MPHPIRSALALCVALSAATVNAQVCESRTPEANTATASAAPDGNSISGQVSGGGVPLTQLIAAVAKKTGKKFVLDPRARADVNLIGQNPASVSYGDLMTILQVYGFAAVDSGGYVQVVPSATVRTMAVPQVSSQMLAKENLPDAEYVTSVIHVKSVPAAQLVPILRPLLVQQGHLAAEICSNSLLIVETLSNVRRIDTLVRSLETAEQYKPQSCEPHTPP